MIEKLDLEKRHSFGTLDWLEHWNEPSGAKLIETKVNELIDAVNSIVSVQEKLIDSRFVVETKHDNSEKENCQENEQDRMIGCTTLNIPKSYKNVPYAEQQKWIGKLCRCWDSNINDDVWGILQDIKDNKTEKYYLYGIGYEHCEPVKPDDDIIYKGGDNE